MENIFYIKLILAVFSVLGLSLVVDHVSPRVAGVLSGYPIGAAISLFFYGLEIGETFAADSAVYTLAGLVATEFFVYVYYRASVGIDGFPTVLCSLAAVSGYFLFAWLIHFLSLNRFSAVLITVASIFLFARLFRPIENERLQTRVRLTAKILLFRAFFSAALILIVTGAAKLVGERWAGLFSAFPVTLFPLILIVHITYGIRPVHTIIKNFPAGLGSLVIYCLVVSAVYPPLGIYWGTALSFMAATLYLIAYGYLVSVRER